MREIHALLEDNAQREGRALTLEVEIVTDAEALREPQSLDVSPRVQRDGGAAAWGIAPFGNESSGAAVIARVRCRTVRNAIRVIHTGKEYHWGGNGHGFSVSRTATANLHQFL